MFVIANFTVSMLPSVGHVVDIAYRVTNGIIVQRSSRNEIRILFIDCSGGRTVAYGNRL